MNEYDIVRKSCFSTPNPSDWKHSEDKSEYIYLPDPRIKIVRDSFDQVTDFFHFSDQEEAFRKAEFRNIYMVTYRICFDKNAVLSEVMLLIDDGTAIVPMPESGTNLVPEPAYRLAFLLVPDTLDEYMTRIGFQVMPVNSINNQ